MFFSVFKISLSFFFEFRLLLFITFTVRIIKSAQFLFYNLYLVVDIDSADYKEKTYYAKHNKEAFVMRLYGQEYSDKPEHGADDHGDYTADP